MALIAEEILDQPRAWSQASTLARGTREALPAGERIAVIGCGSSWYAAKAVAALRELNGGERRMLSRPPRHGSVETTTESSRSPAQVRRPSSAVRSSSSGPARRPSLSLETRSAPSPGECDLVVDLSFAADRSVVQTRFVTTTVCFARVSIGVTIDGVIADAEAALSEPHPVDLNTIDHVVVLGREWLVGLADAGALTVRETAQLWAES